MRDHGKKFYKRMIPAGPVKALGIGLLFCAGLSLLMDINPYTLLSTIWTGAWGSKDAAVTTLTKLPPLLLTGLAISVAFRARLLNIGCEGQLTLGALAAAGFAVFAASLPSLLLLPLTLLVGAITGGLWAIPAIWLRQRRGVHEVITTLLMNYVAIYLADFLVLGPLGDGSAMGRTPAIPEGAAWPILWQQGVQGLTAVPFLAVLLTIAVHFWFNHTYQGFEVTATGSNPLAARTAGIAVESLQRRVFTLSGALAGLAGALEVVAVHHRYYRAFSPGYGFDGITVSFLVDTAPGYLSLSGLLLASLRAADKWLQLSLGISPSTILVIQAVLLLAIACQPRYRALWREKEEQT